MGLKEIEYDGVEQSHLAQDAVQRQEVVEVGNGTSCFVEGGEFIEMNK
jgi:hypothetical protein